MVLVSAACPGLGGLLSPVRRPFASDNCLCRPRETARPVFLLGLDLRLPSRSLAIPLAEHRRRPAREPDDGIPRSTPCAAATTARRPAHRVAGQAPGGAGHPGPRVHAA